MLFCCSEDSTAMGCHVSGILSGQPASVDELPKKALVGLDIMVNFGSISEVSARTAQDIA